MEIRDAEVILTRPGRNYVIIAIETANGLIGWGDATLNGRERAVEAALKHHILPGLSGRDPRRIEDVWQSLFRHTYWRGGLVLNSALSGVDMALWDLKGKQAGMPVYDLLGGRTRNHAQVYARCGGASIEEAIKNCEEALSRGIDHLRVNLYRDRHSEYLNTDAVVSAMSSIREALGSDPHLIIDLHGRTNPNEAVRLAKRLEEFNLFFLEDPLRPEHSGAFERLRERSTTSLAMGELFTNPWEMLPLIEDELVDFIRTDLAHVGGITAADKIAAIGEHHYVLTAFHGPPDLSPIGYAATVHLGLSLPNFGIQELTEHSIRYGDAINAVFDGGVSFVDGMGAVDVRDEPGLGITVDKQCALNFEYKREHLPSPRNPDGSVQDW
jgi:mannonate dehydratase